MSNQRYQSHPEVTSKILDGEAIIINLSDGAYYSLTGAGAVVWALLGAGRAPEEIGADLAARFGVEPPAARADVERLVAALVESSLIAPAGASALPTEPAAVELPPGEPYEPPRLEKFTDMVDMFAIDPPMPGIRDIAEPARETGQGA